MQIIDELEPGAVAPMPERWATSAGAPGRWIPPSRFAPASCAEVGRGFRPAPASSPIPTHSPSGRKRRRRHEPCCSPWRSPRKPRSESWPSYPLVSDSGDQSFELPPGKRLVVGRGLSSDIALYDPTISRRHAELTARTDGVQIKDLGSSNGTFVNGAKVTSGRIQADDTVTFGRLMFHLKAPPRRRSRRRPAPPAGMIVRQVVGDRRRTGRRHQPRRAAGCRAAQASTAASAEARQAKKLSMLLDVSQKLSGEFDLDRLLRTVVDMTFEIMNVDRVTILLRDEATERAGADDLTHQAGRRAAAAGAALDRRQGRARGSRGRVPQRAGRCTVQGSVHPHPERPQRHVLSPHGLGGPGARPPLRGQSSPPRTPSATRIFSSWWPSAASPRSASRTAATRSRSGARRWCARISSATSRPTWRAEIAQQAGAVRLGGERRPTTVLFSDIRGFTAMAESMGPDAIAQLLSEYFTEMVDVIFDYGGTLDKFMGDAIMALWGAPIGHARRCRPGAAGSGGDAAGGRPPQRALGERGQAGDPGGHRHQSWRGVCGQHREPPPPRLHRDRRRGERGRPPLRGGRPRRGARDRKRAARGARPGGSRVSAGDGPEGKDPGGAGVPRPLGRRRRISGPRSPPLCPLARRSGRGAPPARAD